MYMVEAIIDYVSEPGQTVLDPFGGTGTILLAAIMKRHVIAIELETKYQGLMESTYQQWLDSGQFDDEGLGNFILLQGDCRLVMPVPCDHAIFSPPYSQALSSTSGGLKQLQGRWKGDEHIEEYELSNNNLAKFNVFLYGQAMRKVYQKVFDSLPVGGTMTVIIKDQVKGDQRIFLSTDCITGAQVAGFRLWEWHKWKPKGSPFTDIAAFKGADVVRDEDIIMFRKEWRLHERGAGTATPGHRTQEG
jgi:DNA modification methylase